MTMLYGDSRLILPTLDEPVQLVFTSPPYFGQRVYGGDSEHEIGWGDMDHYLGALGAILDELERLLVADGVVMFVMGDKAAGSGGAGGDHGTKGSKSWIPKYGKTLATPGLEGNQWLLMPERFAMMAQARGWLVRSMIVWDKSPSVKPEDLRHIKRPMISTERIVMLTRQVGIKWFPARLVERADIWHVRTGDKGLPKKMRHYAPFPVELPTRGILAFTEPGDVVLDPFAGRGTTVYAARDLGRRGIGVELYDPDHIGGSGE